MRIKIKQFELLVDWGAMILIGDALGSDPIDPLKGLPVKDSLAAVLYGGTARWAEERGTVAPYSLDQCKELIKSFSGYSIGKLTDFWIKACTMDVDDEDAEQLPEGEAAKKK